jgi:hypothetical protein
MATGTLTAREARDRQVFIDAAFERNPAAGKAAAVLEGAGTWREWRSGFGGTRPAAGAPPAALTEAVATAVSTALAAHRRARKAGKKAARESAARRLVLESRPAGRAAISEAVLDRPLTEMTNEQLAGLTLAAPGRSPFAEAAPGGAVVRAAVTETAVSETAQARDFARLSADGLHEQLAGRLTIVGEASGFRSPTWTGGRAHA